MILAFSYMALSLSLDSKYYCAFWWFRIRASKRSAKSAVEIDLQSPVSDRELLNGSSFRSWRSTKRLRIIEHSCPAASIRGSAKRYIRVSERGPPEGGGSVMTSSAHQHRGGDGGEWKFEKQFR